MIAQIFVALIGWLAGIIVNYLADFLPRYRRFSQPICLNCETKIPYFRFFIWDRRCPACQHARSRRTWLVEIISIISAIWLWNNPPMPIGFGVGLILLAYFILVAIIDIENRLILHPVSAFGGISGLGLGIWLHGLTRTVLGGLAGLGVMLFFYLFGILLIRLLNRWRGLSLGDEDGEALGFGDVILGGVLGLILGWPGVAASIFLTILLAGLASLIYMIVMVVLRRYQSNQTLPYGPFLVLGAVVLIYFHEFVANLLKM
jgi:leader peptidase (prepilin peptidase) / N-methyltransferase